MLSRSDATAVSASDLNDRETRSST
jgi:hypothetical protein